MKQDADAQDVTLTSITTYNRHHAKLLLSSLALSVTGLLHEKNGSQPVDAEYIRAASQLFVHCFNIIIDTLTTSVELGKYQLLVFILITRSRAAVVQRLRRLTRVVVVHLCCCCRCHDPVMLWLQLRFDCSTTTILPNQLQCIARACFQFDASKK